MYRALLILSAMIFVVACNSDPSPQPNSGGSTQTQTESPNQLTSSVVRSSFDLSYMQDAVEIIDALKVYDFEDDSTQDITFPVKNAYANVPELVNGQLSLLTKETEIASTETERLLSELTFTDLVQPQNSLVRLRVEGDASLAEGQSMWLSYGIKNGLWPAFDRYSLTSLNASISNPYPYNWLPVSNLYDVGLMLESEWETEFSSIGSTVNIDTLIIESYPLQTTDWQGLSQSASVDQWNYCDQDKSALTAEGTVTFLDDESFVITGSVFEGATEVIQFDLDETSIAQNQVQLFGVANSTWLGHEGYFTAHAIVKDLSVWSVALKLNNCQLNVVITNDLMDRLEETSWQTEAAVDFSILSDIGDVELVWTASEASTKPAIADYERGKALMLTPGDIHQHSYYPEDYENYNVAALSLDSFASGAQVVEISVDFFGYPGENEGCDLTHFNLDIDSENGFEGINISLPNYLILHDSQRLFISSNLESIQLSVSAGGDSCVLGPSHKVFMDNLTIRQFEFPTTPFAGEWEISLSTNPSEVCTLADASELLVLDDELSPFDITLSNGARITAEITVDGQFTGSANAGGYLFDIESQFFHAEVARAYSEDENGCPYFVNIHRRLTSN